MATLKILLLEAIAARGSITIADYMALALRHPEFGYYTTRDPFGKKGDFITAPEVSQLFGEMLGIWAASVWQQMGGPPEMALVELGPGRGTMMSDILRTLKKMDFGGRKMYGSISLHLVEISPALEKLQRENLAGHEGKITWHQSIATLPELPLLIFANEFFDALPVRQFIRKDGGENEIVIKAKDGKFYFSPEPGQGDIIEISPESREVIGNLAEKIVKNNGALLVIDYGYIKSNGKSSLQAVKNHRFHDFLQNPGEADLTAHVNFSDLKEAAQKPGVQIAGPVTQKSFLEKMGILVRADILKKTAGETHQRQIEEALARLLEPAQMGELFKVMAVFSPGNSEPAGF